MFSGSPCLDCALPTWAPMRIAGTCHAVVWRSWTTSALLSLEGHSRSHSILGDACFFVERNLVVVGCFGLVPHPRGDVIEPVVGELSKDRPTQVARNPVCEPRPLIVELDPVVARAAHAPRFQRGSRGWRPGAAGSRAAFGNLEGGGPACHVVVHASFHLVSPPARKLRQCGVLSR